MKFEVGFNLAGVIPVPRCVFVLINQKVLTQSDLFWYTLFASQAEFGHKFTTVGIVTASDKIIAQQLNCNPTTVNKKRNRLIKLGLLEVDPKGTKIKNYSMFTSDRKSSVVAVTQSLLRNGSSGDVAKLFQNEELFMKKRQELIEAHNRNSTKNL